MNNAFVVLLMIFLHIIADYNLQGWLATAKTKDFWEQNAPEKMYKKDYIYALLMHSIMWTFLIMLPIAYVMDFNINIRFINCFLINIYLHANIDDLKANKKTISLVTDQNCHLIQIFLTAFMLL